MSAEQMTGPAIDGRRIMEDLAALAEHGTTPEGGVTRVAYSEPDLTARDWLDQRFTELGFTVARDQAGNSVGVREGTDPALSPIALGSHTDSVPDGGRYDGSLGVVAALACVRALDDAGHRLRHPLAVINFQAEEATMGGATLGSRAMVGDFDPGVLTRSAVDGRAVAHHLNAAGLDPETVADAAVPRGSYAAFVELHVEQGPRLESAGTAVGVVEGIVGIRRYGVSFSGAANHAGTTPMEDRRDALVMAVPFVTAVRDVAAAHTIVGTVGTLRVQPGSPNVIPGRVDIDVEIRSVDDELLARAEDDLRASADEHGAEFTRLSAKAPMPFSPVVIEAVERAARAAGLTSMRLWSGAGHDAGLMTSLTDSGMIFVPSRGGVSHSAAEFTAERDCIDGADVLLRAVVDLDARLA